MQAAAGGILEDTIRILLKKEHYSSFVADAPTASKDFYGWKTVSFNSTLQAAEGRFPVLTADQ